MLTSVSQFSMDFVCAAFAGNIGPLELAAVSEVQNVIIGFAYGVMFGMGSALERLSGQAVGAAKFNMLGIYLQRSWIITVITALFLTPIYHKIWVMTILSIASLAIGVLLNWVLVTKVGQGLFGAAMAANISWWFLVIAQIVYVASGHFPEAWMGFSLLAFKSLTSFLKLSLSSAIMLCLEIWYFPAVILLVGALKNATNAVDAISICMNLQVWTLMVALGFNVAVSVRVSNELGDGNPKAAKCSILVNFVKAGVLGLVLAIILLAARNHFPAIFTDKLEVKTETSKLGYILAVIIFLTSVQQVLQGVAVGAGWQFLVSMINIGCYYVVGLPIGALLGYKFKLGVQGHMVGNAWWLRASNYHLISYDYSTKLT